MTRTEFIRKMGRSLVDFEYRGVPITPYGVKPRYPVCHVSQTFTCKCGFTTRDSGKIWDHCQTTCKEDDDG